MKSPKEIKEEIEKNIVIGMFGLVLSFISLMFHLIIKNPNNQFLLIFILWFMTGFGFIHIGLAYGLKKYLNWRNKK